MFWLNPGRSPVNAVVGFYLALRCRMLLPVDVAEVLPGSQDDVK